MTTVSDSPGFDAVRSTSTQGVSASFFSMRSVSCCSTCCALAPGHRVRTTMTLKVKSGSSARPSWKYEMTPPIMKTIIR
jgi:hypothetical protein